LASAWPRSLTAAPVTGNLSCANTPAKLKSQAQVRDRFHLMPSCGAWYQRLGCQRGCHPSSAGSSLLALTAALSIRSQSDARSPVRLKGLRRVVSPSTRWLPEARDPKITARGSVPASRSRTLPQKVAMRTPSSPVLVGFPLGVSGSRCGRPRTGSQPRHRPARPRRSARCRWCGCSRGRCWRTTSPACHAPARRGAYLARGRRWSPGRPGPATPARSAVKGVNPPR
jgi:hypothetical protein